MEFQSQDPNFSVSWLFGLQPYPTRPRWAGLYESKDRHFRVSRILGLIPSRKPRRSRKRKTKTPETATQEEGEAAEADFGLRRLFSDGTDDEDQEEQDGSSDDETVADDNGESPVLAETGFLELCLEMESLLDEIE